MFACLPAHWLTAAPASWLPGWVWCAEGAGDLLDDFVLAATEQGPEAGPRGEEGSSEAEALSEYSEVESEEEEGAGSSYAGSGDPGWRPCCWQ